MEVSVEESLIVAVVWQSVIHSATRRLDGVHHDMAHTAPFPKRFIEGPCG